MSRRKRRATISMCAGNRKEQMREPGINLIKSYFRSSKSKKLLLINKMMKRKNRLRVEQRGEEIELMESINHYLLSEIS